MRNEVDTMSKFKTDVKVGDIIHIYHMFGYPEYKEVEGVVIDCTDDGVFGTWGPDGLNYDDDWEIIE